MKRKEVWWPLGTLLLVIIIHFIIFGIDGFKPDATQDINIYDTYFVIGTYGLILPLALLLFFGVYLFRMLRLNFKNLTVNMIFMVLTILLVLILNKFISFIDSFAGFSGFADDSMRSQGIHEQYGNLWENIRNGLFVIKIVLLILLPYCGFKTGLHFKYSK